MLVRVYPRVCGGTEWMTGGTAPADGLSPRMRGNPVYPLRPQFAVRSIPAYAGEPVWQRAQAVGLTVYPRVCGGTRGGGHHLTAQQGLSPRMRGNLATSLCGVRLSRSIPAYAGEPLNRTGMPTMCRVYPRVCGGTWVNCKFPA